MDINRREFLRRLGIATGSAAALAALEPFTALAGAASSHQSPASAPDQAARMTYRVQRGTGEQVSLLGFGMMRLPRDNQELVNQLVDYAIAHGVNYFDTAPMYGGGLNEGITGAALSRHPREKYYVATKTPLPVGFSRQEYWSRLPFPSPGGLPDPGIKHGSPPLQADSFTI